MREKVIRNIALLCSVAGLLILFYASEHIEMGPTKIGEISIDDVGISMRICGRIENKRVSNNHIFMDLGDITGKISFVIFNTTALKLNASNINVYNFSVGDKICSTGVVEEYPKGSGELEIIYRRGNITRV